MARRNFRTFVSGKARVSIVNGNQHGNTHFIRPDYFPETSDNEEINALLTTFSGIIESLEKKIDRAGLNNDQNVTCTINLFPCDILDISGNGIKLKLNDKVETGQILYIDIDLFGFPRPRFEVFGKVVRLHSQPSISGETYYAGIEFINLEKNKREKLINFTFQQQRKYIRALNNKSL